MMFIIAVVIFIILSNFTLFIAPHINEKLQLYMVIPSTISGIAIFVILFIVPLFQNIF